MGDNDFIKNLEIVEKGVYGKDVRQAIYDLFQYHKKLIGSIESKTNSLIGYGNIVVIVNPAEIRPTSGTYYS